MANSTRIEFNESFFPQILQSPAVEAVLESKARQVEKTAKATAPVDTGAYRDSIHVWRRQGKKRGTYVIESTDWKAGFIESKTGNLARALRSAR